MARPNVLDELYSRLAPNTRVLTDGVYVERYDGTRLAAIATCPQGTAGLVDGDFYDPRTGKHFRGTDRDDCCSIIKELGIVGPRWVCERRVTYGHKHGFGRVYAADTNGVATGVMLMRKGLRNSILSKTYSGFDIQSCHPVIFVWFCKTILLTETPGWTMVAQNIVYLRRMLQSAFPLAIDDTKAKQFFNAKLYGQSTAAYEDANGLPTGSINTKCPVLARLDDELAVVYTKVLAIFGASDCFRRSITGPMCEREATPSRIMYCILEFVESVLLGMAMSFIRSKLNNPAVMVCILAHDGFFLHKCHKIEGGHSTLVDLLEDHFLEQLNIEVIIKCSDPVCDIAISQLTISQMNRLFGPYVVHSSMNVAGVTDETSRYVTFPGGDCRLTVIESRTGTGKTYSTAKWFSSLVDVANPSRTTMRMLSLVHLRSLAASQLSSFRSAGIDNLVNYLDVEHRDINFPHDKIGAVVCINSIQRLQGWIDGTFVGGSCALGGQSLLADTVVYIDEISSFASNLADNPIIHGNSVALMENLQRICHRAKRVIVTDSSITSSAVELMKWMVFGRDTFPTGQVRFHRNNFQPYSGIKADLVRSEQDFYDMLLGRVKNNQPFLAAFDTKACCERYAMAIMRKIEVLPDDGVADTADSMDPSWVSSFVVITSDIQFEIGDASSTMKGKFVFYSPSITVGVDYTVAEQQPQFLHLTGRSIDPFGWFQQISRTRNMEQLFYHVCIRGSDRCDLLATPKGVSRFDSMIDNPQHLPLGCKKGVASSGYTALRLESDYISRNMTQDLTARVYYFRQLLQRAGFVLDGDNGMIRKRTLEETKADGERKTLQVAKKEMILACAWEEVKYGSVQDPKRKAWADSLGRNSAKEQKVLKTAVESVVFFCMGHMDSIPSVAYRLCFDADFRTRFFIFLRVEKPWRHETISAIKEKHTKTFIPKVTPERIRVLLLFEDTYGITGIDRFSMERWVDVAKASKDVPTINGTIVETSAYGGGGLVRKRHGLYDAICRAYLGIVIASTPIPDIYPSMLATLMPDIVSHTKDGGYQVREGADQIIAEFRSICRHMSSTSVKVEDVRKLWEKYWSPATKLWSSRTPHEISELVALWENTVLAYIPQFTNKDDLGSVIERSDTEKCRLMATARPRAAALLRFVVANLLQVGYGDSKNSLRHVWDACTTCNVDRESNLLRLDVTFFNGFK
jgi:hypothetical protein